ncbi:mitochondrial antiviral-signaling protein isoform X1 [Enhydra lutris kenyoni]|uniref:Mitochondrial antiviral-signaling protein n=1 Tax=Enhydra lutris kenyoni TaxID=391180 RepID=A0A2Y9IP48_ENHLU|nr:mitochondrial antiviral-signaling protein isoform X1 [Enhydra lutris kenyoni]XP_022349981.1 mitochondrial antiviral-signaling protein isoform X1 [Enhydra lutris kenyoni]XP_022349983.1 mitochondrial antiviral-signaling protein isoform X1 [Enhydra lutris kenyoni]XP_022349984.1 mitochondrial antiviral-signaling protein isoform X1 [Enhydra lutris kenyoni]
MTFAEEKTYEYIRHHYSNFVDRIHVLEILPYLSCLTTSDQDRLRASCQLSGNQGTLWELFNSLRRRIGWVESLISALRACELVDLADEVARIYHSNLPGVRNRPPAPVEPQLVPAEVPRSSRPAVAPSAPHNGYREEEPSFPLSVQDTQPPESPEESSKKVPQMPHPGAVLRRPAGPLESSSDMAAFSPLTSSGHEEQDTELGGAHTPGTASSLPSSRGPVSPSVSFQPLTRSTHRASRLPAPSVSVPSAGTSSSSTGLACAGVAGDHRKAGVCSAGAGVSTSSLTTSTASFRVPASSALDRTVPSKLPASSKPSGTVATNVLTSLPPSKLPINSVRAGTAAPRVPTGLVPEPRMSTSMVPSKVPASTVPTIRSHTPSGETAGAPGITISTRDSLPEPNPSSSGWESELELSKPGCLASRVDSEPFSGCSADLALSYSKSLDAGPDNAPEENEYQSVDSIRIQVTQDPSVDLLEGNPGPRATPEPLGEEDYIQVSAWAPWLRVAATGVFLALFLTVVYRRRLLQ